MNHLGLVARCVGYLSCDRKLAEVLKGLSRFVTSRDTVCTACILLQSIYLSIDPANYLYQRLTGPHELPRSDFQEGYLSMYISIYLSIHPSKNYQYYHLSIYSSIHP